MDVLDDAPCGEDDVPCEEEDVRCGEEDIACGVPSGEGRFSYSERTHADGQAHICCNKIVDEAVPPFTRTAVNSTQSKKKFFQLTEGGGFIPEGQ